MELRLRVELRRPVEPLREASMGQRARSPSLQRLTAGWAWPTGQLQQVQLQEQGRADG